MLLFARSLHHLLVLGHTDSNLSRLCLLSRSTLYLKNPRICNLALPCNIHLRSCRSARTRMNPNDILQTYTQRTCQMHRSCCRRVPGTLDQRTGCLCRRPRSIANWRSKILHPIFLESIHNRHRSSLRSTCRTPHRCRRRCIPCSSLSVRSSSRPGRRPRNIANWRCKIPRLFFSKQRTGTSSACIQRCTYHTCQMYRSWCILMPGTLSQRTVCLCKHQRSIAT